MKPKEPEYCKVFVRPARLEILDALREGRKSVEELVRLTGLSQSNVSQNLIMMKYILTSERDGHNIYYKVTNTRIIEALDIIRSVLGERLRTVASTKR